MFNEYVKVKREDLVYLTKFQCEHSPNCDEAERGACCNSCWVRRWAVEQLNKDGRLNG